MNAYVNFKTNLTFLQSQFLEVDDKLRFEMQSVVERLTEKVKAITPDEPREEIKEIGTNLNDWRKRPQRP